jgi:hypothetical protein
LGLLMAVLRDTARNASRDFLVRMQCKVKSTNTSCTVSDAAEQLVSYDVPKLHKAASP